MDEAQFRDLYCDLMSEIKRRTVVIKNVTSFRMPQIVGWELCYLQLRMICELIALGCLAAHSEFSEVHSKDLAKSYQADKIVRRMSRLHQQFYPMPTLQVVDEATGKVVRTVPMTDPYLTKELLLELYAECGSILHRGTIRKIVDGSGEPNVDFDRVYYWADLIVSLLNHHQIQLKDPDYSFWVLMKSKEDDRVHGHLFKRTKDQHT